MTTIKSGHIDTIEVDVKLGRLNTMPREGEVWFDVITSSGETIHANLPTDELLDALGAVDKDRAEQAEAAIARVEKVLHNHTCDGEDMTPFAQQIRAALTGKKPFELPTTVPARIIAEESDETEHSFTLWSDGQGGLSWWHECEDADEECQLYSPVRLLSEFRNHQVVEA